jgi:hypothetical protein
MSARFDGRAAGRGLRSVLLVGVPCIALGLGAGMLLPRGRGASPSRGEVAAAPASAVSPPATSVVVMGPTRARLDDDDRAALRAMIRDELAAQNAAARPAPSAEARPEPTLSNEQLKAYDAARAEVDQGLAAGVWTEDDRRQLRAKLAGLPGDTSVEVVRPLLIAMNGGKLRFEGRGSVF